MIAPQTETIERFAWEGPLSLWQAIALGTVLAAVFAWTLWREGRLTHRWLIPLFWLFRAATLTAVFWMLLGPTQVTVTRKSTPKSIVLIADGTGSMSVVDSPDPLEETRWELAQQADQEDGQILSADRAEVAANAATEHFRSALSDLERNSKSTATQESLTASTHALDRLNDHLQLMSEQSSSVALTQQIDNAKQSAIDLIAELRSAEKQFDGTGVLAQGEMGRLHALIPRLESLNSRVRGLVGSATSNLNQTASKETQRQTLNRGARSRADQVARVLNTAEETWLKELADTVRIRRYTLKEDTATTNGKSWSEVLSSSAVQASSTDANDDETRTPVTNLAAALEQISRDAAAETIAMAVILTDGRHNAAGSRNPANLAAGLGKLPVHVVPIGTSEMLRDVIVHHLNVPATVAKNDLISIEALVTTHMCADETFSVDLLRGDQVIDSRQVKVDSDRADHRVSFSTKANDFGRHAYRLRIEPLTEEASESNNFADFEVEVIEDSIRVFLADNLPRWEFRYLSNLFSRDKRIEAEQLLFGPELAGTGQLKNRPMFPKDVEGWSRYRVVILGDVTPSQLDTQSQRALREYVTRRGGTVLLIAGRESMPQAYTGEPLEEIIPVRDAGEIVDERRGYHLELTAEGKMEGAMQLGSDAFGGERVWREMSRALPIYSLSEYSRPKPTSHTFIRAVATDAGANDNRQRSFLCWQTVGRGRVVYLAAPATYQLRIRNGDRYHHQFWGQLIRWSIARDLATGSRTVRIQTDKSSYQSGEDVQVIVQLTQLSGEPVSGATLHTTARQNKSVTATAVMEEDENIPGRYLGTLPTLVAGSYFVGVEGGEVEELLQLEKVSGPIETSIAVEPSTSTEMLDTRSNRPLLAQIAQLTGGQVIPPTALSEVFQTANLTPHVTEQTEKLALWNNWQLLSLILFCLACEWAIRKQTGLA